jgi:hypothetical protein
LQANDDSYTSTFATADFVALWNPISEAIAIATNSANCCAIKTTVTKTIFSAQLSP